MLELPLLNQNVQSGRKCHQLQYSNEAGYRVQPFQADNSVSQDTCTAGSAYTSTGLHTRTTGQKSLGTPSMLLARRGRPFPPSVMAPSGTLHLSAKTAECSYQTRGAHIVVSAPTTTCRGEWRRWNQADGIAVVVQESVNLSTFHN